MVFDLQGPNAMSGARQGLVQASYAFGKQKSLVFAASLEQPVLGLASSTQADDAEAKTAPKARTLFTNVHVFDGVKEERIENANVLIEGNLIKEVSTEPIRASGATVIDGNGRTLMPGLIDAHVHLFTGGELGVVKEGAYADLLLVEGNPLEDLKAVTNRGNLKIIMKDGMILKNALE